MEPNSVQPEKRGGLRRPGWRIAWEYVVPAVIAAVVLLVSLKTKWQDPETVLWTIVSYLLTQTLTFQILSSKERDTLQTAIDNITKQPLAARHVVIEALRSFYPAMGVQDKLLQIYRDRPHLKIFAKEVMERADADLDQILSKGKYTMRVATPSKSYVDRWYSIMESLDAKEYKDAEFITMSNIVIWSSDYFGGTAYGNLQSNSKMKIQRIFVVPSNAQVESDRNLAIRLHNVLREYGEKIYSAEVETQNSTEKPQQVETKVDIAANAAEYKDHFISSRDHHSSNNFAIWRISSETKLVLTVEYSHKSEEKSDDTNFEVAGITFEQSFSSLDIADKEGFFRRRWNSPKVIPVQDYIAMLAEKIDPKPGARDEKVS